MWTLKKIKVSDIKENPNNPRLLTEKGLNDLEESIKKFGVAEPPVLNKDLSAIGGHGRKKIFERLNITEVECYVSDIQLTKKQADELGIRLNKNIAGQWDFDILANEFEIEDLKDWGFEEWELGMNEDSDPKIKETELRPYKQSHILISFSPEHFAEVKQAISKLENKTHIEIEISTN